MNSFDPIDIPLTTEDKQGIREHWAKEAAKLEKDRIMYTKSLKRKVHGDGTVTLSGPCVFSGKTYAVTTTLVQLALYESGGLAQNVFHDLSATDREFLISGIGPTGWHTEVEGTAEEPKHGNDNTPF